ncbi:MAG: helix-turn-helix domain-containing protein [Candidatus Roizmanbacteria bacterium]|nr:helix-turn-helix domain-containing protein [Candidatus Roizmanbacteria bacterium]
MAISRPFRILKENVRLIRRQKGMSQIQLALLCDLDRTYISQIENGSANPSLNSLRRLANALDVSLYELLDY